MDFSERVRLLRRARRLSQEALAQQAEVSVSLVNQMERGIITDPHYSTLVKLAAVLDVPVYDLMGEESRPLAGAR